MAAARPHPSEMQQTAVATLPRIGVGVLALLLALIAQRVVQSARPADAVVLFVAAIALYLIALPRAVEPLPLGARAETRHRALVGAGIAACAIAALLAVISAPRFMTAMPQAWGWTLHLSSLGALLLGGLALDVGMRPAEHGESSHWHVTVGLVALVALAALLRLPNLGTLPFGVWHDEAENALAAQEILHNPVYRPFFLGATSHTAHHNYLVALAFAWLGETITAARMVSALMGIAMVAAGYLVAAELFYAPPAPGRSRSIVGPTMGMIFAAILTISSWSLNFSRIAVNYIATPLFILLAVGLLLHGLRTQRMGAYLLSGAALGMGLNFYSSFRLFVPVLPLFLLAALIERRDLWAKSWRGLLLWALAATIVMAPLLTFAATNQDLFLKRSADTFLLTRVAQTDRLSALLDNTVTHLLMFNVSGDRNGRHNLPGRPMLDPWLGALFVVGLAVSLWRCRRPRYLLLLIWLAFTLLGGILTLAFEAPQSLRANGAMLAAYLIALVPLAELLHAWDASKGGRYYPHAAATIAALLMLPISAWHVNQFFVVQQRDFAVWNAFSTPETLTARALAKLDPDATQAYVVSYYEGRPPMNFLAPQWRGRYIPIEGSESMPLIWPADKDVWLFLDADSGTLYQQLQTMYPTGAFSEQTPPFGNAVSTRTVHLSRADLASTQGLEARYFDNDAWQGAPVHTERVPTINFDWPTDAPLAMPFSVEYAGILRIATYGPHEFALTAPAYAELLLDENVVLSGTGTLTASLTPALGNHTLRVRATGAPGPLQLRWTPLGEVESLVPPAVLFSAPINANGLLGAFYANRNWEPPVALTEITPQLAIVFYKPPVPRPFSVEWTGSIAIPMAGYYLFSINAIDEAELWIDEQMVVATRSGNMTVEGYVNLSEGLHTLRVRYRAVNNHSRIGLQWTPPNGVRVPVPSAVLFPPMGSYERIAMPIMSALAPMPAGGQSLLPAPLSPAAPLTGTMTTLLTGLAHPTGIAAGADGRAYVVDSTARTLLVLRPNGLVERTLTGGALPFAEPFDVATDAEGAVYVLDAEAGSIVVFDANGDYARTLIPADADIARARGLTVDAGGTIWVAHTPGQRILAFAPDGTLLHEYPAWPGEDAQVTDVAVAPDGTIFAVAMGINKLIQYDSTGTRTGAWDIAAANTLDAPHLALDAGSPLNLYISQPEESRIVLHAGAEPEVSHGAFWQLPQQPDMVKPIGLATAADGSIWIADGQGSRVLRLEPGTK